MRARSRARALLNASARPVTYPDIWGGDDEGEGAAATPAAGGGSSGSGTSTSKSRGRLNVVCSPRTARAFVTRLRNGLFGEDYSSMLGPFCLVPDTMAPDSRSASSAQSFFAPAFRVTLSRERGHVHGFVSPPRLLYGFSPHGAHIQRGFGWIRDSVRAPLSFRVSVCARYRLPVALIF